MIVILVAILAFVAVAGIGLAFAGDGGGAASSKTLKRAQTLVGEGPRQERVSRAKAAASEPGARRKQILRTLKEQEKQQRKASLTLEARLRQAGLSATVQQFWIASAILGAVVFLTALLLRAHPVIALGVGFAAGGGLPRWIVDFLAKRRTKKFTEAFSDAIDIIVRGIKSGLPVHDCLRIIAAESPEPLAGEFRRLVENLGMGVNMDQALEKMYERMPTSELRFFTIVLNIQQKTGGNLAEALGNLSVVLRARKMMREKIKALSAEAIASASIIGCLPPGVVILISVVSPQYIMPMFTDSRGHLLLMIGGVWMTIGIVVMRKMINFKF